MRVRSTMIVSNVYDDNMTEYGLIVVMSPRSHQLLRSYVAILLKSDFFLYFS